MKYLKLLCLSLLIIHTNFIFAQDLSKNQIQTLTQDIIKTIDKNYIIPELRNKIVAGLQSNLNQGKYNQISNKSEFVKIVNQSLYELSNDKHLYLVYDKDDAKAKSNPRRQMRRMTPNAEAFKNLLSYKMLEGNLAYLNVPIFAPLAYVKDDIDKYLEMSLSADALVIDVRQCPGGSGQTTAYLAGGFIVAPTHLTTYYSKDSEDKSFSTQTKFGKTNQDKDVYVLVSERSGSAAEGFAFYLQQLGRVKVVGMQSSGAGRSNQFFPLQDDFSLSVSIRTSMTPNGKQFQGVGVTPNVITPSKNALNQAQIEAFLKLSKEKPTQKSHYQKLISNIGKPEIKLQRGDKTKIKASVLGYIENFFENNTEEMYKYLHPELAKRGMSRKPDANTIFFQNMTKEELTAMLKRKKALPKAEQKNTVEILDVFANTASVKLKTGYPKMQWIEYILLSRINNEWKIVDILWDYYPKTRHTKTKIKK